MLNLARWYTLASNSHDKIGHRKLQGLVHLTPASCSLSVMAELFVYSCEGYLYCDTVYILMHIVFWDCVSDIIPVYNITTCSLYHCVTVQWLTSDTPATATAAIASGSRNGAAVAHVPASSSWMAASRSCSRPILKSLLASRHTYSVGTVSVAVRPTFIKYNSIAPVSSMTVRTNSVV